MDYFALADTIQNRRLRFAAPSTFPDKNEGLEIMYNSLRAAVESDDGSYSGIANQDQITLIHNALKRSSFVCSWSREAESIALWSLYSVDRSGIRISSTVSKLQTALDSFAHSNSMQSQFARYGLVDGTSYAFVQGCSVKEVTYENLRKMHEDILSTGQSQQTLADQKMNEILESFTLKDIAYKHEEEIRGIVTCGSAISTGSNGSIADSAPWLDGDHLYLDVPSDFIESVAIDPRCPRYKREIIEGYLRDHNIFINTSKAFGYLPDDVDFVTPEIRRITK
jgi:hypothetical protein